jgi:hypothetical protein
MNIKAITLMSALSSTIAMPALAQTTSQSTTTSNVAFIAYSQPEHVRVTAWIGASVKTAANETIGDVNDFIIGGQGKVIGVVTGVGGFLGLGEKNVALDFDSVTMKTGNDGKKVVLANTTKQALSEAPEYKAPGEKSVRDRLGEASDTIEKTYKEAKQKASEGVDMATKKAKEGYAAATEAVK